MLGPGFIGGPSKLPVLLQAVDQDFEAFFEREIRYRRALRYPPLVGLVQVLIHDRERLQAEAWAAANENNPHSAKKALGQR